jgi:fimbrial isopeptide formation D2 family protein/LPXTG-motif cell wall-anchored protein
MKKIHRVLALLLAALMAIGLMTTAFAEPTIDTSKKASLSIYKYDITTAGKDGAWDAESYVSTGLHDGAVTDKLSKYAIQGVEFTYLRVADVTTSNDLLDGQRQVGVLYGFDGSDRSNAVLSAIGLTAADAHKTEGGVNYFTSDMLNNKLATALAANATNVKNALETTMKNGGVAMPETDATGHTSASNMEQGLYLVVETRVPENVTSTCNPFFVSLPMTTIDGAAWNYDVTVYPKNQTGNPTLDKTVREAKNSTGKNTGSLTDIKDGYAHTATASVGDTVDYQIISTLPTITSKASSLSEYTYADTLSKGIRYNKNNVVIEFFRDAGCTEKIATWDENSGKFIVAYDAAANIMTIRMTDTGLSEINEAATVYTDSVKCGYSDCTMRISYAATLTADAKMGDTDNPNEVELTWRRTNNTYFDTLKDCCHVYTYGIDILKQFSDNGGNLRNVKFRLHNDTDDVYVVADLKDGVYYAKGITSKKSDATTFIPNSSGHIVVKGLEDDAYSLTEIATGKGYVLLKDAVKIVIKTSENGQCEKCGAKLLTASATVNDKDVTMTDGNAIVPLTVVNNPGFDLPKTGGYGTWMFTVGGVALLGAAAFIVVKSRKRNQ